MTIDTEIVVENKHIRVKENEYRLSIEKRNISVGINVNKVVYRAFLSDVNSQFTTEYTFNEQLLMNEQLLIDWIKVQDKINDPETRFFNEFKQWNGIVEL